MSDYMFMLENHLNSEQARFLAALEAVCGLTNTKVFLAGGAMRDMLGGFPLRDLDFVVEGPALKLARELADTAGASIVSTDELRKSVEMQLPRGSTVSLAMARTEKYLKAGGKPQVSPATMYEDLLGRDFTINAIALSLSKASRGLLMDPSNGLADIERRELRAVNSYVFYNDPVRLWRLIRLKVRLGFAIEERTAAQYANAREAEMEKHIPPRLCSSNCASRPTSRTRPMSSKHSMKKGSSPRSRPRSPEPGSTCRVSPNSSRSASWSPSASRCRWITSSSCSSS